jgi:protein farnesyltransferase subunit beta
MTFLIKGAKSRHKARFATRAIGNPSQASSNTSEDRISNIGISQDEARSMASLEVSSNPSESADEEIWVDEASPVITIPGLFTTLPPLRDRLVTDTTVKQDGCVKQCLPFLSASSEKFSRYNSHGVPNLDRARHIKFLHKSLGPLPAPFAAADAARPWFFYWALCALSTFGEDVSSYRECLIGTVRPLQNSTGGFAGGYGQMSHLATTYACVLSLAIVGGEDAIDTIDRKAMWKWLVSLKQTDGGFRMFIDGEEDVR